MQTRPEGLSAFTRKASQKDCRSRVRIQSMACADGAVSAETRRTRNACRGARVFMRASGGGVMPHSRPRARGVTRSEMPQVDARRSAGAVFRGLAHFLEFRPAFDGRIQLGLLRGQRVEHRLHFLEGPRVEIRVVGGLAQARKFLLQRV